MNLAILGWGSLVWAPGTLEIQKQEWQHDGPRLPLEFARISTDRRLTLVLKAGVEESTSLWAISCLPDLAAAQQNLFARERQGKPFNKDNDVVGYLDLHSDDKHCVAVPEVEAAIRQWAGSKGLDGVLWTDLSSNFEAKQGGPLTADNVIAYLNGLDRETRAYAEEYILRAPEQIQTPLRKEISERIAANYRRAAPSKVWPPAIQPPKPADSPDRIALVNKLRAEILDLKAFLDSVHAGDTQLPEYQDHLIRFTQRITELLQLIPDDDDEDLEHLNTYWRQMSDCPLLKCPGVAYAAADQARHLATLDGLIRKVIFLTSYITIPERLVDWLKEGAQGYYIPFHEVFQDELPNADDRTRMLKLLKWAPELIERRGGLVDADSGLIYWYSRDRSKQWWSLAAVVLVFLVMLIIVLRSALPAFTLFGIAWVIPNWTSVDPVLLASGWLAVIMGIVVHEIISSVKRGKSSGLPPILPLGESLKWINAHEGDVIMKLALSFIVFYGLAMGLGLSQVQVGNAFLVGYSIDSVVELLGQTLDQRADALSSSLKTKLGPSPAA